jgi:hypothetical protein
MSTIATKDGTEILYTDWSPRAWLRLPTGRWTLLCA